MLLAASCASFQPPRNDARGSVVLALPCARSEAVAPQLSNTAAVAARRRDVMRERVMGAERDSGRTTNGVYRLNGGRASGASA